MLGAGQAMSEIEKLSFIEKGVGISGTSVSNIATPLNICNDMVDLFNSDDFSNKDKIWCDIYCKTGNTAKALLNHGVNKDKIILICNNEQSQLLACRQLYGKLLESIDIDIDVESLKHYKITRRGQVYCINKWEDLVKNYRYKAESIIKFVIGKEYNKSMGLAWKDTNDFSISNIVTNPPYNDDLYIAFVELSKAIAKDNVVAITPAKWQAKGGKNNNNFRQNIVPHMKKVVYYPEADDVFNGVICQGGICYYSLDCRNNYIEKELITKCKNIKCFETNGIEHTKIEYIMFNETVRSIARKLRTDNHLVCKNDSSKTYVVGITNVYSEKELSNKKGKATVLIKPYIQNGCRKKNSDTSFLNSFDTEDEAKSYISYIDSKLMRFGFLICKCSQHMQSDFSWIFIPDPGEFDHIFTDEELYKKYNLTPEEIEIIESVIKERK